MRPGAAPIAETPPDAVTIALQADAVYGTACSVIYYALDPPFEWASGPRFARLMRESLRDGVGMLSEYDYDYACCGTNASPQCNLGVNGLYHISRTCIVWLSPSGPFVPHPFDKTSCLGTPWIVFVCD